MAKVFDDQLPLGQCEFSAIHRPLETASDILGYYDRFRAYIEHEDGLISSRLTWSLTVHGFLFAMYGILLAKIADAVIELHRRTDLNALLVPAIAALFFFQIPIAAFGIFVGHRSRKAIKAAHNAIHHIYSIALASSQFSVSPVTSQTTLAVAPGPCTITTASDLGIQVGSNALLEAGSTDNEEVVEVIAVKNESFDAICAKPHRAGVLVRPLGWAILPKVISGGAKQHLTKDAQYYYLGLPKWATVIWSVLCLASLSLGVASLWSDFWLSSIPVGK
jgi:hypothetical protein